MTVAHRSRECAPSMRTSGSTTGTSPASWARAAYRASACALASMQAAVGVSGPIRMTARHLANRAPRAAYSTSRSRSPSSPCVTTSSGDPASGVVPRSTLMPGTIPARLRTSAKGVPSWAVWRMVSSNRMTPLTWSASPGEVRRSSR